MSKTIRLRITRGCLVRGVACDAGSVIEVDCEAAADLLMAGAAEPEGTLPAGARITPAIAWHDPSEVDNRSFRVVSAANEATH